MDWVCSPKLGLPEGPVDVAELAKFPVISYPRVSLPHHIIEKQFRGVEHPAVRLHLSGSLSMTIQLLVDAVGASVLPAVLVQRELAEGSLRLLSVREPFPALRVSMSYLDVPENPLPLLIVPICQLAATEYCRQFESRFASAYDQSSAEGSVLS
jgi:DNA-binding transcriptional LysR family regulator